MAGGGGVAGGGGPDGLKQFKGNCQLQSVVDDAAAAKVPNDFHDKNNSSSCSPKNLNFVSACLHSAKLHEPTT